MNLKIILEIYLQQKQVNIFHYSMSTISLFISIENKHDVYRDKDYMKQFCESLREQATEIIIFLKKK